MAAPDALFSAASRALACQEPLDRAGDQAIQEQMAGDTALQVARRKEALSISDSNFLLKVL
jgi:hypothetical protein